jgi:hypothetical protein
MRGNLEKFIKENSWIGARNLPILVIAVAATRDGFEYVQEYIENTFRGGIHFRACEILGNCSGSRDGCWVAAA